MQKSILAVSDDKDFLEEIRSHLEEGGRFRIRSASSGAEALNIAENETFDVAILDAEISDIPFVPFTRNLVATHPYLKLLIYPPYNNPHHPVIKGLVANGFLNKPFFAPEVGSALADLFVPQPEVYPEDEQAQPDSLDVFLQQSQSRINGIEQTENIQFDTPSEVAMESSGITEIFPQVESDSAEQEITNFSSLAGEVEELPEPTTAELPDLEADTEVVPEPSTAELQDLELVTEVISEPTTAELPNLENEIEVVPEPTTAELPDLENEIEVVPEPTTAELPDLENETGVVPEPTTAELPDLENETGVVPKPTTAELSDLSDEEHIASAAAVAEVSSLELLQEESGTEKGMGTSEPEVKIPLDNGTHEAVSGEIDFTHNIEDTTDESILETPPPLPSIEAEAEDAIPVTNESQMTELNGQSFGDFTETTNETTPVEIRDLPQELEEFEESLSEGVDEDLELPDWLEGIDTEINDLEPLDIHEMVSENELSNLDSLLETSPIMNAETLPEPLDEIANGSTTVEFPPPLPGRESDLPETAVNTDFSNAPEQEEPIRESEISTPLPSAKEVLPAASFQTEEINLTPIPADVLPQTQVSYGDSLPGTSPLGVKGVRLDYTCVIIPGNPNQFIARDLSERLGFIMPQLHVSNGWRMNGISVRPQYISWRFSIPASVCPMDAVAEIKQRTTAHFYANFPELTAANDQNDFWAPGYLIVSGKQTLPATLIQDFIQRTRTAQREPAS